MLDTSPLALAQALIRCPSVTPVEGGALSFIAQVLGDAGFEVHRPVFSSEGTPDVENLYARFGVGHPHLVFAGHTDVVPPGDVARWRHDPFGGIVEGGELFGRGATDMKGGVACMMAAALRYLARPSGFLRLDRLSHHRRRGGSGRQRHREAARLGKGEGRALRPLHPRRADESRGSRRHDQDRPARLAHRPSRRARQAGPCRLSAPRREPDRRDGPARRGVEGRTPRRRHRAFRRLEPRVHDARRRQSGDERHPDGGAGDLQHPLQRPLVAADASRRRSRRGCARPPETRCATRRASIRRTRSPS